MYLLVKFAVFAAALFLHELRTQALEDKTKDVRVQDMDTVRERESDRQDVVTVRVKINVTAPMQRVGDRFLSFAIDTTLLQPGRFLEGFNFSSPKARALARALQPSHFRIGGTLGDALVFNGSSPHKHDNNFTFLIGPDMWDAITDFASAAGDVRFVFGLNALYRPAGGHWDPTNALSLLKHNRDIGFRNIDFELGNEPNAYKNNIFKADVEPEVLGEDFRFLREVLDEDPFYGWDTELFGPDNGSPPDASVRADYMKRVVEKCSDVLSAVTFHHYYLNGATARVPDFTNASVLDRFPEQMSIARREIDEMAGRGKRVWIGETSSAVGGGAYNISDRFVAGFSWLDKLGVAARFGVQAVVRQTFFGLNYGLLDSNMDPNPDFWLSAIYKKLVGSRVLDVVTDQTDEHHNVRVYAHCTDRKAGLKAESAAVTVYASNLYADKTAELRLEEDGRFRLRGAGQLDVYQYLLEPFGEGRKMGGGMLAKLVTLNGKLLRMVDEHTLPPLQGIQVQPPLRLPPRTFAFFVISASNSTAAFPACR